MPRAGLDTVVGLDSLVCWEIRPGGASLLEITYLNPTEQLDGIMTFNNGRHVVFDGLRYHATYVRYDADSTYVTSTYDTVFYRFSRPLDALNHVVVWDGPEIPISTVLHNADTIRFANRTPSITVRRDGADSTITVATIVWTAHVTKDSLKTDWRREVVTRNYAVKDGQMLAPGKIQVVDYHLGSLSSGPWGTPVVSSLHGGDCFSWSDSTSGIMARVHTHPALTATKWWDSAGKWSNGTLYSLPTVSLAVSGTPSTNTTAQFPTMPAFSLQSRADSVAAISWQEGAINSMYIKYNRLVHGTSGGTPGLVTALTTINLTPSPGKFYHPNMDQVQWQDS